MPPSFNITLRRATPNDATCLRAVLLDTFESTWRPNISAAATRAFLEGDRPSTYITTRRACFWLAERNGSVVGFVDREGNFVNALHVLLDHARTGVGALLMNKVEAEMLAEGFRTARLETDTFNLKSQAFYAARGYVEAGRYPDEEWNSGLTTILLTKSLL